MQSRALLMIEHRLIERMIKIIQRNLSQIENERKVDPVFVDTTVDFIRTYADRTHHGKEEDILFRELAKKNLSEEDKLSMKDLMEEHRLGRKTSGIIVEANNRYRNGDTSALTQIVANLRLLADFYPKHIEKEDKFFFPSSRRYFSEQEDQTILKEFCEFDAKMIHEKYRTLIESFENQ